MDWNRFTFDYRYEFIGLLPRIVTIEANKEAALNLVLPPGWKQQLDRLNRVRAVYGTTALEGNPLSEAEVSKQLEILDEQGGGALETSKLTREQVQIINSSLAQAWVRRRFQPGTGPIEVSDILEMHRMVTEHSDTKDNIPGRFRPSEVTVGSPEAGGVHKGAPYAEVERLMDEYVRFVNSRKMVEAEHPVVRALLAHFFLVTIHPFGDGNGRVSRLVEAGILYQNGYNVHGFYGLSNYFYRHELEYKTTLQKCREDIPFDVSGLINFGINGFAQELKGINNFIKTKLNRIVYRTMLVRNYNKRVGTRRRLLNQREYSLLEVLINETEPIDPFSESSSKRIRFTELNASPYVRGAYRNVTTRTFHRELIRLASLGFITFTHDETVQDWIVELDFGAVEKF
jgi:Fic family protein